MMLRVFLVSGHASPVTPVIFGDMAPSGSWSTPEKLLWKHVHETVSEHVACKSVSLRAGRIAFELRVGASRVHGKQEIIEKAWLRQLC